MHHAVYHMPVLWPDMHHAVYHMPATKCQIFTMLGLDALGFRLTLVEFVIISTTILCKDWGLEKRGA